MTQPGADSWFTFLPLIISSNGEMWLGLEYMYYVQKSHGQGGTKLCSYIAADRTTYQYVCYDKFAISNWQEDYKISQIGKGKILLIPF